MAFDTARLATVAAAQQAQLPCPLVFGGVTFKGCKGTRKAELRPAEAGQENGYEFSWMGIASDFTPSPVTGQTVTIAAVTYRVLAPTVDAAGIVLTLDLGGVYAR